MSKKERLTDEELNGLFEGIGDEGTTKTAPKSSNEGEQPNADLLEELGMPERPKSSGRHTPQLNSSLAAPRQASPQRSGTGTPPSNDGARSSEEKLRTRKSGESSRSVRNSFTPASTDEAEAEPEKPAATEAPEALKQAAAGGGWWNTITSTATAAVKQAEALAKEIQQNEEAQRWAEQVKGNVTQLRGIGMSSYPPSAIDQDELSTQPQAVNFALAPFRHLQTSFIPWLLQFPHTNVFKYTSPTTSSAILPSIP